MKTFHRDFAKGLMWNYISIIFLAAGGIVFSFLIGVYYDAETLGGFQLTYAYYIVFSQVGVWGSHMAVTKYVSEYAEDRKTVNIILSSGLLIVGLISIVLGGLAWGICNLGIRELLGNSLRDSINAVILAVLFFSMNKVILGYLNGLSRMKEYAVFQSMRNILIALWIIIFAIFKVPGYKISFCFAYAEIIIFLVEIPLIMIKEKFSICFSTEWIKKILVFGTRIMPANIVLELSTKVDILCLSWILRNEELVGIYSFAALFAEGFYQLFVVIRRSINPLITQNYIKGNLTDYYEKVTYKIRKVGYLSGTVCLALLVAGYRVLCFFIGDSSYYAGTFALLIIAASIVCNMKSIIFGNILSQTGNPTKESVNNILTVTSNFILNILFIFQFGMIGAAVATGTSYFVFSISQRMMMRRKLNLH